MVGRCSVVKPTHEPDFMVQISAIWVSQTTHMATIPIPKPLGANPNFCPWLLTIIYDNRDINQGYPKNMLDISQMPK